MRRSVWLMAVVAVLAALGGGGYWYARRAYQDAGPLPEARAVSVPRGSLDDIGHALAAAGVIENPVAFRAAALATEGQGPLHAGELLFPERASLGEVLFVLRNGRPVQHKLTIPEGLTAAQISRLLERADGLTGDGVVPAEGELLPQTYAYDRGATREAVAARARVAMDHALAEAWAGRDPELPLADPHALLTLASMVERETSKPEERAHVAGVFVNRLRQGMRLQSDPTVIYAVAGGLGPLDRRLSRADLAVANPYNTYVVAGLPPGPIDSPGAASLAAAARPLATDDLYFVADGGGGHAFATTLDEHQRNVARWRAAIRP